MGSSRTRRGGGDSRQGQCSSGWSDTGAAHGVAQGRMGCMTAYDSRKIFENSEHILWKVSKNNNMARLVKSFFVETIITDMSDCES